MINVQGGIQSERRNARSCRQGSKIVKTNEFYYTISFTTHGFELFIASRFIISIYSQTFFPIRIFSINLNFIIKFSVILLFHAQRNSSNTISSDTSISLISCIVCHNDGLFLNSGSNFIAIIVFLFRTYLFLDKVGKFGSVASVKK